jgi:hypothetical protein
MTKVVGGLLKSKSKSKSKSKRQKAGASAKSKCKCKKQVQRQMRGFFPFASLDGQNDSVWGWGVI